MLSCQTLHLKTINYLKSGGGGGHKKRKIIEGRDPLSQNLLNFRLSNGTVFLTIVLEDECAVLPRYR